MAPVKLRLSAELPAGVESGISKAAAAIQQLNGYVSSFCVPNHVNSRLNAIAAAKRLSGRAPCLTYTQVCRGLKSILKANEMLSKAAKIRNVKEILAVTGDKASGSDISIFDLIAAIDKKRFRAAAAIVFTRKGEAGRVRKKAAAGATVFYTQPVFPGNWRRLASVLNACRDVRCRVFIGIFIPFSAAACSHLSREKPGFISDASLIRNLAAAERKGAIDAFNAVVDSARDGLLAANRVAASVNRSGRVCRVGGFHFYGLVDRTFGKGKSRLPVAASVLLRSC